MAIVTGIFKSRREAEQVVDELRAANVDAEHIGFLTPEMTEKELEARARITDSERPGLGKAMGAVVGGAIGAAGGATLGAAVASLAVPGVGPVIAAGVIAAALLGTAGAATGAVAGEATEEFLGEGLPHEDLFVYEDALRKGQSVVVAFVDDEDRTKEMMKRHGSLDVDQLRDNWWQEHRNAERTSYQSQGGDFDRDEESYRRGFQAALHGKYRGKTFDDVQQELRNSYDDQQLDSAFRQGYERGRRYQVTVVESYKA
ncbi:MAG TPA: hypothetical protein VLA93_14705 [Pyrinomonadaceae bacterium]|nr:hypothetical protein [Pyrinomonadaceae bacterium]